ncbi:MAG: HAD family hydrolase [Anaerolineales bacterium]
MTITALFFDFDGLILDTETPELRAWEEIYRRYGLTFPLHEWSEVVGGWGESTFDPAAYLLRHLRNGLSRDALVEFQREVSRTLLEKESPRPGVQDLLEEAYNKAVRCFVVSSSSRLWVEGHLKRLELWGYFESVICADDVLAGYIEPHPHLYLKALEVSALHPLQVLALEDSPNGVRAARTAGLRVVAIPNPVTERFHFPVSPDARLDSLQGIKLQSLIAIGESA